MTANDGVFAVPTEGAERGWVRQFFSAVREAEVASLELNFFNNAMFIAVQHPGENGSYEEPTSLWPDKKVPSRPSVVVVTKRSGDGVISPIGT